jgi:hypothetical protein
MEFYKAAVAVDAVKVSADIRVERFAGFLSPSRPRRVRHAARA